MIFFSDVLKQVSNSNHCKQVDVKIHIEKIIFGNLAPHFFCSSNVYDYQTCTK